MPELITGADIPMGDFPVSTLPLSTMWFPILDLTISDPNLQNRLIQLLNITSVVLDFATAVAHPTGGQPNATPISNAYTRFITVATAGDSAKAVVPSDGRRQQYTVVNAGVAAMDIFPPVGGQLSNLGTDVAYQLNPGGSVTITYSSGLQFDLN